MRAVTNKTTKPLSIPLPRGKILRLGPKKTGQISSDDVEHPPLKKLVDAGEIEIHDEGYGPTPTGGTDRIGPTSAQGRSSSTGGRRSGDR